MIDTEKAWDGIKEFYKNIVNKTDKNFNEMNYEEKVATIRFHSNIIDFFDILVKKEQGVINANQRFK